jgi:hypothetical protein
MSFFKQFINAPFLKKAMYAVLAVMVVLNAFFISSPHPHFEAERIPGFWAIFGLGVAVALAKLAKGAAHTFLGKDLDFYEKHEK